MRLLLMKQLRWYSQIDSLAIINRSGYYAAILFDVMKTLLAIENVRLLVLAHYTVLFVTNTL